MCVKKIVANIKRAWKENAGKREKGILDVTGVRLTPEKPHECRGNGIKGFECCCEECDYFLLCFPEFDLFERNERSDGGKTKA